MSGPQPVDSISSPLESGQEGASNSPSDLQVWSMLMNQLADAGANLGQLFTTEVRLALGDARRMFFLLLLAIPFVLLTWVSFAMLIAWLAFDYTQSVSVGLMVLLIQQLLVLRYIQRLWRQYSYSLTLPKSRQHLHAVINSIASGDTNPHDSQRSDPGN